MSALTNIQAVWILLVQCQYQQSKKKFWRTSGDIMMCFWSVLLNLLFYYNSNPLWKHVLFPVHEKQNSRVGHNAIFLAAYWKSRWQLKNKKNSPTKGQQTKATKNTCDFSFSFYCLQFLSFWFSYFCSSLKKVCGSVSITITSINELGFISPVLRSSQLPYLSLYFLWIESLW